MPRPVVNHRPYFMVAPLAAFPDPTTAPYWLYMVDADQSGIYHSDSVVWVLVSGLTQPQIQDLINVVGAQIIVFLNDEVDARTAADLQIMVFLNDEVDARTAADLQIMVFLDDEVDARTAADLQIMVFLDDEVDARTAADIVLADEIAEHESDTEIHGRYLLHDQAVASAAVTITHSFGKRPNVSILVGEIEVDTDVEHLNLNQTYLTFPAPTIFQAILTA